MIFSLTQAMHSIQICMHCPLIKANQFDFGTLSRLIKFIKHGGMAFIIVGYVMMCVKMYSFFFVKLNTYNAIF